MPDDTEPLVYPTELRQSGNVEINYRSDLPFAVHFKRALCQFSPEDAAAIIQNWDVPGAREMCLTMHASEPHGRGGLPTLKYLLERKKLAMAPDERRSRRAIQQRARRMAASHSHSESNAQSQSNPSSEAVTSDVATSQTLNSSHGISTRCPPNPGGDLPSSPQYYGNYNEISENVSESPQNYPVNIEPEADSELNMPKFERYKRNTQNNDRRASKPTNF